jgi:HlyD family secretion protein
MRFIAILLVIVTALSVFACTKDQPATQPGGSPSASSTTQPARTTPAGSPAAKPGATSQTPSVSTLSQTAVVRGNGTVAASIDSNLNFATGGEIEKIGGKEGGKINKRAFFAKLDTASLEAALSQAKVALDQANLAKTQAETALASAQFTLDKTKAVSDIKDVITNLQWQLKIGEMNMAEAQNANDANSSGYWSKMVANYRLELAKRNKDMAELLGKVEYAGTITYDIMGQKYDRLTVEDMRMKQLQVESAQQTLDKSQSSIDQAQKNLNLAQQQLNDATIIAPFGGIIAKLNFKEGDYVPTPSQSTKPIVYLVDMSTMKIDIGVNELDMPKVKIGQQASIKVDAYPDVKLEGKVTAISPMPTVQGGVVDYPVTISFSVPSTSEIRVGMNGTGTVSTK